MNRPKYLLLVYAPLSNGMLAVFGLDLRCCGPEYPEKYLKIRQRRYKKVTQALDNWHLQIEKMEANNVSQSKIDVMKAKHNSVLYPYLEWLWNDGLYEELVEWHQNNKAIQ